MTTSTVENLLLVSARQLGIPSFKPKQEEAICNFIAGHNVFVSLPTGYGNSACYMCLSMVVNCVRGVDLVSSMVFIVSPLIAILEDQVKKCYGEGITAVHVGENNMTETTRSEILSGRYQIIFSSPESVLCNLNGGKCCYCLFTRNILWYSLLMKHIVLKIGELVIIVNVRHVYEHYADVFVRGKQFRCECAK